MIIWEETINWAIDNGYTYTLIRLTDGDFYYTNRLRHAQCEFWNYEPRKRPSNEELDKYLEQLSNKWINIAGQKFANITMPLVFAGKKARVLVVEYKKIPNLCRRLELFIG